MPETLAGWLEYIERQHTRAIDLGLERLLPVKAALKQAQVCPLIIVGGTNGKGSTCAMLEAILRAAGYRVGLYTSPHLLEYNERVRVDGRPVGDAELCTAFAKVEVARGDTTLTYFEFATLAAWEVFASQALNVIVLEVGLGGRLDAVNIYDADCAIVTGIDIDHTDYLGSTREQIAFEKAGILRKGRPAICGDTEPPSTLLQQAHALGAALQVIGRDFGYLADGEGWRFWQRKLGALEQGASLPLPALRGQTQLINASVVLAALDALHESLPVSLPQIERGLLAVSLPGRFQRLPGQAGRAEVILDVAHNPQSARVLAENLASLPPVPQTWAVFGMLADKDIAAVIEALKPGISHWLPCSLQGARGASKFVLSTALANAGVLVQVAFDNPAEGFLYARENASEDDRIIVFGSFFTVAEVMQMLKPNPNSHG